MSLYTRLGAMKVNINTFRAKVKCVGVKVPSCKSHQDFPKNSSLLNFSSHPIKCADSAPAAIAHFNFVEASRILTFKIYSDLIRFFSSPSPSPLPFFCVFSINELDAISAYCRAHTFTTRNERQTHSFRHIQLPIPYTVRGHVEMLECFS